MSKRIRDKARQRAGAEARSENNGLTEMATEPGTAGGQQEGTSPNRLMLILWGVPLLILVAALVVQQFR